jgi:hydroxymethylbilane synthase
VPTQPLVRIGARGSKLSRAQAGQMQRRIAAALGAPPEEAERVAPLTIISTTGDRVQDRRLLEIGGKGLFTKEIEEALLDGRIDCAVHSMKDMPALLPEGLCIAAIPEREDPRDALLTRGPERMDDLSPGARLGTASLRRQAQALHRRPDLQIQLLRGNVDAILLAFSGLKRLGLGDLPNSLIDPLECPPAPGQGALAIETRSGDRDLAWLQALRHEPTHLTVAAERGALTALEASCRTAMGAHAWLENGALKLVVEALSADGRQRFRHAGETEVSQLADLEASARDLGLSLGGAVREAAGDAIGT